MTTIPAGPPLGAPTPIPLPLFRTAAAAISRQLDELHREAEAIARERNDARRTCEEALQEAGRLRARVEELETQPDDPVQYLLWSGRHQGWWKPEARGYTADIERAGRYSRTEALFYVGQSALCGVREQVTSMVAAPENWPVSDG